MKYGTSILLILFVVLNGCYTEIAVPDINKPEDKTPQAWEMNKADYYLPTQENHPEYDLLKPLFRTWDHSREEEKDSVEIYRPRGSRNYPPSRFRNKLTFSPDGNLEWLAISPTDGFNIEKGIWRLCQKDPSIIVFVGKSKERYSAWRIIQLDSTVLRIKPVKVKPVKR